MNCREAQDQIFAERDSAPESSRRAALEGHVAHCASCQRIRADLAAAFTMWRTDAEKVTVPDAEREWHAVRRRIRGGVEAGAARSERPRRNLVTWFAVPLGAAAALALALFVSPPKNSVTPPEAAPQVASAESIDVPGRNASTMVFMDDKSGWLIVWANDEKPKQG